jgi:hypothetical protein
MAAESNEGGVVVKVRPHLGGISRFGEGRRNLPNSDDILTWVISHRAAMLSTALGGQFLKLRKKVYGLVHTIR